MHRVHLLIPHAAAHIAALPQHFLRQWEEHATGCRRFARLRIQLIRRIAAFLAQRRMIFVRVLMDAHAVAPAAADAARLVNFGDVAAIRCLRHMHRATRADVDARAAAVAVFQQIKIKHRVLLSAHFLFILCFKFLASG